MRNPHVNACIAEYGFLKAMESALKTPEAFEMSEAEVATKMKIMGLILAMHKETIESLSTAIEGIEARGRQSSKKRPTGLPKISIWPWKK